MHRKHILGLSLVLTFPFIGGCGSAHEQAMGNMVSQLKQLNDVLEMVTSKTEFEASKEQIESITEKLYGLHKRIARLKRPSSELAKELEEKFSSNLKTERRRVYANVRRIAKEETFSGGFFKALGNWRPGLVLRPRSRSRS